jgi:hypothetical protein
MTWREEPLPDDGEWLTVRDAAALESRLLGREVSPPMFRRWLRDKSHMVDHYTVRESVNGYAIERGSMLRVYEEWAMGMLLAVRKERGEAGQG